MAERLFDPLAYIKSHGGIVRLEDGRILVTFEWATRERREDCHRVARRYERLLRMQLDVGPGERARTVRQLVAAGRVLIDGGQFRLAGEEHGAADL